MTDTQANNKRIAKNTLLLYARMMFIMCIQLFTSRVVLNTLGVVDYGIYNVVGGIVSMFTFLNGAMSTSTQRYITYNLGKGNMANLKTVFTTSVQIHALISIIVVILAETIGIWFLYNKMIIPADRLNVAFWVFQLSILTAVVTIMSVPYNSDIIAHEKMSAFAYISVIEVTLKLLVVYLLYIGNFDKLLLYAVLLACIQLLIRWIYTCYCNRHFEESKLVRIWNKKLFKEMGCFAGWNMWGNLAGTLFDQGINMLLNVFFGPAINAARAVAVQVNGAIMQFSSNFLVAVNPQITKTYAQGDLREMHKLIFRASKFAFMLLFILSLPVVMEINTILNVWLKNPPQWTGIFVCVILCAAIVDAVARPFMTAAAATGDVKVYQSVVGGILLAIVPIAYIVLKLGGNPVSVFIVHLSVAIVAFVVRLFIIRPMIKLSILEYLKKAMLPIFLVLLSGTIVPLLLRLSLSDSLINAGIVITVSVISASTAAYIFGLTSHERAFINSKMCMLKNKVLR